MATIGIENISVFGLPPVEFVGLAADLGCRLVSMGLTSFGYNPHVYPAFSLRDDASLRRETIAAMADRGVSISLGEGLTVRADRDIRDMVGDFDTMHALGIRRVNTVSMDPDRARSFDQFAIFAEMAAERDMVSTIELVPSLTVADLPTALEAVRHVGRPDFTLLVDTMHWGRAGVTPAEIAALDPDLIGYVQLCDAPREPRFESYFEESMYERMVPGEGGLDVEAMVAALPRDRVFSLEIPLRGEAEAGLGPHERLGRCVEAAKRMLARVEGEKRS